MVKITDGLVELVVFKPIGRNDQVSTIPSGYYRFIHIGPVVITKIFVASYSNNLLVRKTAKVIFYLRRREPLVTYNRCGRGHSLLLDICKVKRIECACCLTPAIMIQCGIRCPQLQVVLLRSQRPRVILCNNDL